MTILIEHSTVPVSATAVSSAGTVRWMSPELLFGQDSTPTRQSDCYALGMVIYEVGWPYSLRQPSAHLSLGSDWSPTISPPRSLRGGDRCTEREASQEAT